MKRDFIYISIILLLIIFGIVYENINKSKREDDLISQLSSYSDTVKFYKLNNEALISSNKMVELHSQKQFESLAKSMSDTLYQIMKKFKKVQSIMYATNNFYTAGDTIKSNVITCDFDPYKVRRSDSTYSFVGTVAKKYFSIDSLYIPNKLSIVTGRKKTGFLKSEITVDVNNSNSRMVTTNIQAYTFSPEKRWYEKTWVHMLAGASIQTLIYSGINYLKR